MNCEDTTIPDYYLLDLFFKLESIQIYGSKMMFSAFIVVVADDYVKIINKEKKLLFYVNNRDEFLQAYAKIINCDVADLMISLNKENENNENNETNVTSENNEGNTSSEVNTSEN